jgi:hypothetical protein
MSAFKVVFATDSESFDNFELEVSRILRKVADQVESGKFGGPVLDSNGNQVGVFTQGV